MPQILKKEDIGSLSKFIKANDTSKKNSKVKDIAELLLQGKKSEIVSDVSFIAKNKKKIKAYAHILALKNGTSQISNITISPETNERELFELISDCINHSFLKNCKNIELTTENKFEKLFRRMNFDKVGEKDQSQIFMRYRMKKEVQSDLKEQFKEAEFIQDITEKTSEQLRKLR